MRGRGSRLRASADRGPPGPGRAEPPRPSLRRRALALAFGLAAGLLLTEAGLRVLHAVRGTYAVSDEARRARLDSPWTASDDPELVYVHRPGMRVDGELKIEAHGILRPTDVGPRAPGVPRVLVVGDSVGAALWLRHEERFPARIERALSDPLAGRRAEVLNLCVNGYDSLQEARLLETVGTSLEPDAVVLAYCLNDPATSVTPRGWFVEPDPPASYALATIETGLRSVLGRPSGRPLAPGAGPRGEAGPIWERMYDPEGDAWRSVLHAFDRVAAWSRARGVPVLVAIVPLLEEDDPAGAATASFRRQVAEAALARGLPVEDLQDEVAAHPVASLRHRADDIYHFDVLGQEVLAAALLPHVRALYRDR